MSIAQPLRYEVATLAPRHLIGQRRALHRLHNFEHLPVPPFLIHNAAVVPGRVRSQLNGLALGRERGMINQVAVAELGRDLGRGGFSAPVALEAEQALMQAWVCG